MRAMFQLLGMLVLGLALGQPQAKDHAGKDFILQNGYQGPQTCETCHPGKAKEFLGTVHWKHASKVDNVEGIKPGTEVGMKNRIYTMCNGNDIVNQLKETPPNEKGKTKFTGCNTCHPGSSSKDVGATGPAAEAAIDCLLCHSTKYDFRKRTFSKQADGSIAIGQDRSTEAAANLGKPSNKNCMVCHESAGGGVMIKRGFAMNAEHDVHSAKKMACVDCHVVKNHKFPTGYDPNNWAHDGERVSCSQCHGEAPHNDKQLDRHMAKIACQTCHIPKTGGAIAKDFTQWEKQGNGFWEPSTLKREVNETTPVYAWYNLKVANRPDYIGPKGSRADGKIYPFKVFQGKAFFNKKTGELLSMDFAQPMATGDSLAGVASAAKTLGIKDYVPVPGWQTIYFASSHQVAPKGKALGCSQCHAPNGVLNFKQLGYKDAEIRKLTNPELYFQRMLKQQEE